MTSETSPKEERRSSRGFRREARYGLHLLRKNPIVLLGSIVALASVVLALSSGLIVDPNLWKTTHIALRLCWNNPALDWNLRNVYDCSGPTTYALGTDNYGRDVLRMIILAIPLDLEVSLEIVLSAVLIGTVFGGIAAYAGGSLDELILRLTDIFLAVPSLLLAIVLAPILVSTLQSLTPSALVTWWPTYVRLMRSQVLTEKEKRYVEALRAVGAGRVRSLFRHNDPNSISLIVLQGA